VESWAVAAAALQLWFAAVWLGECSELPVASAVLAGVFAVLIETAVVLVEEYPV